MTKFLKARDNTGKVCLINLDRVTSIEEKSKDCDLDEPYFCIGVDHCDRITFKDFQIISSNGAPIKYMKTLIEHLDVVASFKKEII